eukprot:1156949-Pelagomonas_calceolata.AAC.5
MVASQRPPCDAVENCSNIKTSTTFQCLQCDVPSLGVFASMNDSNHCTLLAPVMEFHGITLGVLTSHQSVDCRLTPAKQARLNVLLEVRRQLQQRFTNL